MAILRLGVVADDVTGAGDIAGMTAKAGYRTVVRPFPHSRAGDEDICVIDTDSRLATPETAYTRVFEATKSLAAAGCAQYFNKTCSVFRGNVGAEFDAMLDALGESFAVIVLGFPKNGRLTRGGVHYVHGRRLEESEFRTDPVHPMARSNLIDILQAQTRRKVAHLDESVVRQGVLALRLAIERLKSHVNYVILDVTCQDDLVTIAGAVSDCRVLCGSSALAEELAVCWPAAHAEAGLSYVPEKGLGVLGLAGSLTPQTQAQLGHLKALGVSCLQVDLNSLFEPGALAEQLERVSRSAAALLERGAAVIVHTPFTPAAIGDVQRAGESIGLSKSDVGRRVSAALGSVAARVRRIVRYDRLIVAGGDTSATICRHLHVGELQVLDELSPGVPAMLARPEGGSPLLVVLKSGSFGAPDFLEQAVRYLENAA